MDFRQRFLDIHSFLQPYQTIWQNEIMLQYPDPLKGYPQDWVNELLRFQDKMDIICLEKKENAGLIILPSLIDFYDRIEELTLMPSLPPLPEMPSDKFTFVHIIPKKQYEIQKLAPLVHKIYQELSIEK